MGKFVLMNIVDANNDSRLEAVKVKSNIIAVLMLVFWAAVVMAWGCSWMIIEKYGKVIP